MYNEWVFHSLRIALPAWWGQRSTQNVHAIVPSLLAVLAFVSFRGSCLGNGTCGLGGRVGSVGSLAVGEVRQARLSRSLWATAFIFNVGCFWGQRTDVPSREGCDQVLLMVTGTAEQVFFPPEGLSL